MEWIPLWYLAASKALRQNIPIIGSPKIIIISIGYVFCIIYMLYSELNIFLASYEIIIHQFEILYSTSFLVNYSSNISNYSKLDITSSMKHLPTPYMVFVYPYMCFYLTSQGGANIFFSVLYCWPCELVPSFWHESFGVSTSKIRPYLNTALPKWVQTSKKVLYRKIFRN